MKGFIEIAKAATKGAPGTQPRAQLEQVLLEKNTVLCLVFGSGEAARTTARNAGDLAGKQECKPVRVVLIHDDGILTAAEAVWRPGDAKILTLLTSDRKVSRRMTAAEASDAGDLLLAMIDAVAGVTA